MQKFVQEVWHLLDAHICVWPVCKMAMFIYTGVSATTSGLSSQLLRLMTDEAISSNRLCMCACVVPLGLGMCYMLF